MAKREGAIKNLYVNENQWTDVRVGATQTKPPTVSPAEWEEVGSSGLYLPRFTDAQEELLYFEAQLPHSYNSLTDIHTHIHWLPDTTSLGTMNWRIDYLIASINQVFHVTDGAFTTGQDCYQAGDGVLYKHQLTPTHIIDGLRFQLYESACIFGTIFRDHSDGDDYVGSPFLISMDFHIRQDKIGSVEENLLLEEPYHQ